MRTAWLLGLALALSLTALVPGRPRAAEPAEDRLVEDVRQSIKRGVDFLRGQQRGGNWETSDIKINYPGGFTSLALLALLNSGVPATDPAVQDGLKYLRTVKSDKTYVVGLQTMVFALAAQPVDREAIQRNVDWLLAARLSDGWTYGKVGAGAIRNITVSDNSNTQYALLGLHEALQSGFAKVDKKALEEIQAFYVKTQVHRGDQPGGGWYYRPGEPPSLTMTTAGLCNLIITGMDLRVGKQVLRPDGSTVNCGVYEDNKPVADAIAWIGTRFPSTLSDGYFSTHGIPPYYALYGVERAGRLTGQRYFGGHDWYEVGCRYLVSVQKADGSWGGRPTGRFPDYWPVVATSFSLLFLSKGRTPVLITKLAYGPPDNDNPPRIQNWDRKRSDVRHLVEFSSRELFKKQPLAWQVFDVRARPVENDAAVKRLAAQLLESPVVYFNGHHQAPRGKEKAILKEYLENGGFIFAEACCGDKGFDADFRKLVRDITDENLKPLPPEHPVWLASGKFAVPPGKPYRLEGVQKGCKTVVIYSPQPLAGYWEANEYGKGNGKIAFQLGANVIAYATGLEPPLPRGHKVKVVSDDPPAPVKRGYLKVAQLKHEGDWKPAPKAMRNLMAEARKVGLDVVLATEPVDPTDAKVKDYYFFYLHGRRSFSYEAQELKDLRFRLKYGGTLFADACCGSAKFDESFRKFVAALWEGEGLKLVPIPPDDELYSKELNGQEITTVRCRRAAPDGKHVEPEYRSVPPALEGVKYGGRWVVIYSRYDIGCALEHTQSSDCLGHDYPSAARLGKAAVLYALKR
jgi:hypothetical protein